MSDGPETADGVRSTLRAPRLRDAVGVWLGMVVVGVLWAGLTVAFEFGFGHYVAGEPWESLFERYDVTTGHVWVLVPLFMLVAPSLFGRSEDR